MEVRPGDPKFLRTDQNIVFLLRVCYSMVHEVAARILADHELTVEQWLVLMKLKEGPTKTAADVGHQIRYDTGALVRLADTLETRGWIQRRRSTEDRRKVELSLTAAGNYKLAEVLSVFIAAMSGALHGLSAPECDEILRLMNKLLRSVQSYSGPGAVSAFNTRTGVGG